MTDPRLDRRIQFDERSRSFPAAIGLEDRPFRSYTWSCDIYNDQKAEGACVGFAWTHELAARPKVLRNDDTFARKIYYRARQLDPWEGEDYEGTSVLAGIKAVQEIVNSKGKPLIKEYRWAFGIQDVLRVLGYRGPVVLGIWWYDNMYDPDENGFIHLAGTKVGGHAILANGVKIVKLDPTLPATWVNVNKVESYVRLHNSWGTGYGLGGDALISVNDLELLLMDDGEACVPTSRSYA